MLKLTVDDGSGRSASHTSSLTVGRAPDCDLVLADETVSSSHLRIWREGNQYAAEDLESVNGSYLIGAKQPFARAMLQSGDVLLVGQTRLRVTIGGEPALPAGATGLIRLHVTHPPEAVGVFTYDQDAITIGRHHTCDLVIPDDTVSRRHAVVQRGESGFVINDQKALNAVYLDRKRVQCAILSDGQEIQLGYAVLRVEIPGAVVEEDEPVEIDERLRHVAIEPPRPSAEILQARLAATPLFAGFKAVDWRVFLKAYNKDPEIHVARFRAHDTVVTAGHYVTNFDIVLTGEIAAAGTDDSKQGLIQYHDGDFYGLVECKRSLMSPITLVATKETFVLHIPRHQIRFIENNRPARELLAARHKEETWRLMVSQLELFQGLAPKAVEALIERSAILFFDKADMAIARQGDPAESFYLVRDGFVKFVEPLESGAEHIRRYVRAGEFFGEQALLDDPTWSANVMTAGRTELVRIHLSDIANLCANNPEIRELLQRTAKARQAAVELQPSSDIYQSDALLVMDMDLCVNCDLCVDACRSLHGESRLTRRGKMHGKYLVPNACRHCDDPVCMTSCPEGAIKRRPEGEIYIDYNKCTGVGACAIACPYDNIEMIETNKFDRAQARKQAVVRGSEFFRPYPDRSYPQGVSGFLQQLLGLGGDKEAEAPTQGGAGAHAVPASYPIKCDLCDGLAFMGCVHACPTGAAIRIKGSALAGEEEKSGQSPARRIHKAQARMTMVLGSRGRSDR